MRTCASFILCLCSDKTSVSLLRIYWLYLFQVLRFQSYQYADAGEKVNICELVKTRTNKTFESSSRSRINIHSLFEPLERNNFT